MTSTVRLRFLVLTGFAFVLGCETAPPVKEDILLANRLPGIRRILMIPAEIHVSEVDVLGDQKMLYDQSKASANALTRSIVTLLEGLGYEVRLLKVDEKMLETHPDIENDLAFLKEKFVGFSGGIEKRYLERKAPEKLDISLGTEVNVFADLFEVDALVFASATGVIKSEKLVKRDISKAVFASVVTFGDVETSLRVLGIPYGAGYLHVGLVDADTGKLLWHGFNDQGLRYDATDIQSLSEMVDYTLKKFPASKSNAAAVITNVGRMEKIDGRKVMVV